MNQQELIAVEGKQQEATLQKKQNAAETEAERKKNEAIKYEY